MKELIWTKYFWNSFILLVTRTVQNRISITGSQKQGDKSSEGSLAFERHISIGYYALIDYTLSSTFPDAFSEKCEWFDVHNLPKEIAFDHREIIEKGMEFLRINLDYKIYGSNLLPEKFTMKELQNLYECILGEPLRRNNFQRKMLSLDFLERLEKKFDGSANKAPYYYKFKNKKGNRICSLFMLKKSLICYNSLLLYPN